MYYVKSWDTDETISEHEKLAIAKRYCRGAGHTGESNGVWFLPVAYVADESGFCVYNPRFSSRVGGAAGGLINAQPSNHF